MTKCGWRLFCSLTVSLLSLAPVLCLAESSGGFRVIDESAIAYMEFLSKADFDQKFPGRIYADSAELEGGWYVIYEHQKLNYYFGPILLKSIGQDYLAELTQIVDAAVQQRPDIQNYRLVLSYEPSVDLPDDPDNWDGESDHSSRNSAGGNQSTNKPTQPSGFWNFIRRIFGFER